MKYKIKIPLINMLVIMITSFINQCIIPVPTNPFYLICVASFCMWVLFDRTTIEIQCN
jgi:hypothetical protein